MNNVRKDGVVGVIEGDDADGGSSIHFSEWWNGEGLDFTFDDDRKISLHGDTIHNMVVAAIAAGYIDIKECKREAKEILEASKRRSDAIERMRGFQ
jgi:hypothetical protein